MMRYHFTNMEVWVLAQPFTILPAILCSDGTALQPANQHA